MELVDQGKACGLEGSGEGLRGGEDPKRPARGIEGQGVVLLGELMESWEVRPAGELHRSSGRVARVQGCVGPEIACAKQAGREWEPL